MPFEVGDKTLAVPSPSDLPSEMTVYFEDGTETQNLVATALESLESQILYDWKNSFEEVPPISLAVVKKERNFIRVRISAK